MTVSFHVARSAAGPWTKVTANITDSRGVAARAVAAGVAGADNFAFDTPFAHPNGTIYVVTGSKSILRADDWRGPYDVIATNACGPGEDNYIYVDTRGHFHCLYHRAPFQDLTAQGGHAYSVDGYTWHVSDAAAYPAAIQYRDGSVGRYGKRERPHLIFDPQTGEPTHLTNGVCLNGDWVQCNNNPRPGYGMAMPLAAMGKASRPWARRGHCMAIIPAGAWPIGMAIGIAICIRAQSRARVDTVRAAATLITPSPRSRRSRRAQQHAAGLGTHWQARQTLRTSSRWSRYADQK